WERNTPQGADEGMVSRGTFTDWRARTKTLTTPSAYTAGGEALWTLADRIEVVKTAAVSPSLFATLGVEPRMGRGFAAEGTGSATPQFVISYEFWQRAFGGASDVVGRLVQVEGRFSREIIGVMPRGFAFPEGTEAWTRLGLEGPVPPNGRRTLS